MELNVNPGLQQILTKPEPLSQGLSNSPSPSTPILLPFLMQSLEHFLDRRNILGLGSGGMAVCSLPPSFPSLPLRAAAAALRGALMANRRFLGNFSALFCSHPAGQGVPKLSVVQISKCPKPKLIQMTYFCLHLERFIIVSVVSTLIRQSLRQFLS